MPELIHLVCKECKKEFIGKRAQHYCSSSCRINHKNKKAKEYKIQFEKRLLRKNISLKWLKKYLKGHYVHVLVCGKRVRVTSSDSLFEAAKREAEKRVN